MTKYQKYSLFVLRVSMGWMMLYAGVTKITDPSWSAAGYLTSAKSLSGFFAWFAQPGALPFTNFINEWGLTLLGLSLILGIGVRLSAWLGFVLMLLYYFPILDFPYPNAHSYIVDEHLIYAFALLILGAFKTGNIWGLDPKLKSLFG
ncbi:MAG: DoxX family membrane protein [Candidatus Doudnabacteria bacterium]|nr:DoxX family membrane protein [Candidatus Doudnabacteria bacterium]